jgi:hypothetical protein
MVREATPVEEHFSGLLIHEARSAAKAHTSPHGVMATSGKSKRPPPRDNRLDSSPPAPRPEPAARTIGRAARTTRVELVGESVPIADLQLDVARLRAERASDADELGAMLVRVAASDRARDVAEKRAAALEKWVEELEGKVAAARTRGDELEIELVRMKREHEDALAAERARRTFELEALAMKHRAELSTMPRGPQNAPGPRAAREAMAKVIATLEELEAHESQSALARRRAFDQAREFVATAAGVASRAPATKDVPTVPPTKSSARRSRRPLPGVTASPPSQSQENPSSAPISTAPSIRVSAAPVSMAPVSVAPVSVAPASVGPTSAVPTPVSASPPSAPPASAPVSSERELLTFEDLDLGD